MTPRSSPRKLLTFSQSSKHSHRLRKRYAAACIVALLGGLWGAAGAQAAAIGNITFSQGDYSPAEQAAVQRAVDYWNEVITGGSNLTIDFIKAPSGGGWSNGSTIALDSGTTWSTAVSSQIKAGWNDMESVLIHEMAHSLGLGSASSYPVVSGSQVQFSFSSGQWLDFIHVNNGTTDQKIVSGAWYSASDNFTFSGTHANTVWGDGNPNATFGVPIIGLISGANQNGSSFAHPDTPFGVMNWVYNGATRPFFSEVELAILQDMGYTIDIKNFFGRSIYQVEGTITNNVGFNGTGIYGIGLHIVSGNNTITQAASLTSQGEAGAGIRIENVNNTVTIAGGVTVAATGDLGTGVLVTHGTSTGTNADYYNQYGAGATNAKLINRGTIVATGNGGIGVWFHASATQFDNYGTINVGTQNDAICIDSGLDAYGNPLAVPISVGAINLMDGTKITGNITTKNMTTGTIPLTFGKAADATGFAPSGASSDPGSSMYVHGNIAGRFNLQTFGGTTTINGNINALAGSVGFNSTLALTGDRFDFTSSVLSIANGGILQIGSSDITSAVTGNGLTLAAGSEIDFSFGPEGFSTLFIDSTPSLTGSGNIILKLVDFTDFSGFSSFFGDDINNFPLFTWNSLTDYSTRITLDPSSWDALNAAGVTWTDSSGGLVLNFSNVTFAQVPEPASLAILGLGVAAMMVRRRK
ncbi:MAG: PEP-CTERM sorting domain-containing protein [Phycisphaerales bacterium]|nr:PEP-CTERM sorting domain-containing protein [Phycisphaerales bacterium]